MINIIFRNNNNDSNCSYSASKHNLITRCYNDITSPFYGCETWSLTLRGVPGLRVFENRVLRSFISCTLLQV
jgi:hypothetical protein